MRGSKWVGAGMRGCAWVCVGMSVDVCEYAWACLGVVIENRRVKRAGVPRSLLTVCAGVQISRTGSTIMARKFSGKLTMNYNIK